MHLALTNAEVTPELHVDIEQISAHEGLAVDCVPLTAT